MLMSVQLSDGKYICGAARLLLLNGLREGVKYITAFGQKYKLLGVVDDKLRCELC